MRLIDADKVLTVLNELKKCRKQINIDTAIRAVAHTETAEAIPISFVRKEFKKEWSEENKTFIEHGFMPLTVTSYALSCLIERWEKENADRRRETDL